MLRVIVTAAVIVSVCLMVHVAGIMVMAEWLLRRREYFERNATKGHFALLIISLFSGVVSLHLVQTALWALFYYAQGLFSDIETALYFSMVSFATIGYGDVLLPSRWRVLGVVEGFTGVILVGISTAFIFAVMNAMLQLRLQQRSKQN
jgi:voltage-gated potassium channel